jgi:hypothetical protein
LRAQRAHAVADLAMRIVGGVEGLHGTGGRAADRERGSISSGQ